MYTQFPLRLARLAFLLGLAALVVSVIVVFPLQWLSLKAESSASQVSAGYALRAGEPTPQPEFSPAPADDRQLAGKAGRRTVRTLIPVLVFVGLAAVCFGIEIATGPRSG
jgi:predicted cobalt transporter CbtA